MAFLNRFEGAQLDSPILKHITLIDSPGVLSGQLFIRINIRTMSYTLAYTLYIIYLNVILLIYVILIYAYDVYLYTHIYR